MDTTHIAWLAAALLLAAAPMPALAAPSDANVTAGDVGRVDPLGSHTHSPCLNIGWVFDQLGVPRPGGAIICK